MKQPAMTIFLLRKEIAELGLDWNHMIYDDDLKRSIWMIVFFFCSEGELNNARVEVDEGLNMLAESFANLKDTRADLLLLSVKCADFESQIEVKATKKRVWKFNASSSLPIMLICIYLRTLHTPSRPHHQWGKKCVPYSNRWQSCQSSWTRFESKHNALKYLEYWFCSQALLRVC